MLTYIQHLSPEDQKLLLNAPVFITILIAGADDNIDESEKSFSISLSKLKAKKADEVLLEYYKEVNKVFEKDLNLLIESLPTNAKARTLAINDSLQKLNDILPRLDKEFSIMLFYSFKEIARLIAEASGGEKGFNAISREEKELINLPMIKMPLFK